MSFGFVKTFIGLQILRIHILNFLNVFYGRTLGERAACEVRQNVNTTQQDLFPCMYAYLQYAL